MSKLIYLSRHGEGLHNVISRLTGVPTFRRYIARYINEKRGQSKAGKRQYDLLKSGIVLFSHFKRLLKEFECPLDRVISTAGGIYGVDGNLINVDRLADSDIIPFGNITGNGKNQARVLGRYLGELNLQSVLYVTSTIPRTIETLEIATEEMGSKLKPHIAESELSEMVPLEYILEHMKKDQSCPDGIRSIVSEYTTEQLVQLARENLSQVKQFIRTFKEGYPRVRGILQGSNKIRSTIQECGQRVYDELTNIAQRSSEKNIIAVLHGNTNSTFLKHIGYVQHNPDRPWAFHFGNCGLCVLEYDKSGFSVVKDYKDNSELR